ncbi:MAG: hypothetical protein A3C88_02575 [Candidatus Yanofskybacteria bacterium RIFCSPHIGHO2_02_FULL_50_12]|uniref:Uncharacterized protein n=1 Tax=Candidatus Yanofskybacteria bacterium RIFCSPHIGHO2_02_FULL_50_12 TaxID=1802685 RepID=A0A1F8FUY2_9BACT|nr:MAG: hypothetical protein A3C88_02575 [Candidatus Yanofskybacteria bacterium RIFCSPHIGHO2_02_FULL_50_12]
MGQRNHVPIIIAGGFGVLGLILGAVCMLYFTGFFRYDRYAEEDFIDTSTYQAVFLTNDQIYFGYLKDIGPDYLILSDVHYVKINESGNGQLVKLGQIEPHGPEDGMIINQDQVLFWENLKPDSQVVRSIRSGQER